MATKLAKRDYERALSAENGFPVFLTDTEYDRIQSAPAKPPAEKHYRDPFGHVEHRTTQQKAEDARRASPWTTQSGATYNATHGRVGDWRRDSGFEGDAPSKPGINASAAVAHDAKRYSGFEGDAPANPGLSATPAPAPTTSTIGKIAPAAGPTNADYAPSMTYQAPPVSPAVAPSAPIKTYGVADLGPAAGQVAAMPAPKPATHDADMDELERMNAYYAALGGY